MKSMKVTLFLALILAQSISASHHENGTKRFSPWQKFVCVLALASGVSAYQGNKPSVSDLAMEIIKGTTVCQFTPQGEAHCFKTPMAFISEKNKAQDEIWVSTLSDTCHNRTMYGQGMCIDNPFAVATVPGVCALSNNTAIGHSKMNKHKAPQHKKGVIMCGKECHVGGKVDTAKHNSKALMKYPAIQCPTQKK